MFVFERGGVKRYGRGLWPDGQSETPAPPSVPGSRGEGAGFFLVTQMPNADPLNRLREIRDEEEVLEDRLKMLQAERNISIRKHVRQEGFSERKVAHAAGISQPRVHAILVQKR